GTTPRLARAAAAGHPRTPATDCHLPPGAPGPAPDVEWREAQCIHAVARTPVAGGLRGLARGAHRGRDPRTSAGHRDGPRRGKSVLRGGTHRNPDRSGTTRARRPHVELSRDAVRLRGPRLDTGPGGRSDRPPPAPGEGSDAGRLRDRPDLLARPRL